MLLGKRCRYCYISQNSSSHLIPLSVSLLLSCSFFSSSFFFFFSPLLSRSFSPTFSSLTSSWLVFSYPLQPLSFASYFRHLLSSSFLDLSFLYHSGWKRRDREMEREEESGRIRGNNQQGREEVQKKKFKILNANTVSVFYLHQIRHFMAYLYNK